MKANSDHPISAQSILGLAAVCVVAGIVCGMAGSFAVSGISVGFGVLLASFAAFRSRRLTIW